MKARVGIVFGGRSGEHEISIRSATMVIEQIDREKYSVVPIAIDKRGSWLNPKTSLSLLPKSVSDLLDVSEFESLDDSIALIADPKYRGLTDISAQRNGGSSLRLDVIFPVLHGTFGEDGTIQGVFEMADTPYVGCGVLASSCGMDKVTMKALFRDAGLPICKYLWFQRSQWESEPEVLSRKIEVELGYPCFVKPANLGSSVGISRAENKTELLHSIDLAAKFDRKIIVEAALKMREIECGVIGNEIPEASEPGEYLIREADRAFLDYNEKYGSTGGNEFVVPSPVSAELASKIKDMAIRAFRAIDGSGLARVDFFLRKDNGSLLVNEINTMPGLTNSSGFPKMWAGSGKPFRQVIEELITLAVERHQDRARNKTTI